MSLHSLEQQQIITAAYVMSRYVHLFDRSFVIFPYAIDERATLLSGQNVFKNGLLTVK